MIRIPISEKQKEEMEAIYWNWMERYHLEKLLAIIAKDAIFKELVMDGKADLLDALKTYLFSDCDELERQKSRIDNMRAENKYIKQETEDYLKARYENFRNSQAAKIVQVMNLTVCPYCNQNHLNLVYQEGKLRYWGSLDHFYDKKTYPELAVCLYNLIPVCKVCNQLKSCQKAEIAHPYQYKKQSSIQFKTVFDDKLDLDYLQGKSQNFRIAIEESQLTQEDKEEIRLFDLEHRYQQLKQNVQEIIIKSKAYDAVYQKQLESEFGFSREELDAYIFGYTDNHLNRVLSKFNLDMVKEFMG